VAKRARGPRPDRRTRAKPEAVPDSSPSRYIARVSRKTGQEIPGPIDPDELLVHAWRDKHLLEVTAQFLASRAIQLTVREDRVRGALKVLNTAAARLASVGAAVGGERVGREAKRLMGVVSRDFYFQFREPTHLSDRQVRERVQALQKDGRAMLRARGRSPRLHVLVTGATGFLGKEILVQAAADRRIDELVAVVRPETVRDPKTKEVVKVLSPEQRGALLLKRLHITGARAQKFRFVPGDIERPDLGIAPAELARLETRLSHVIHCAASVSFDDPY
jgi:male sterility protein